MKKLVYLLAPFLLVACGGEDTQSDEQDNDQTAVEDTVYYPDSTEWDVGPDTLENEVFLEEMPSKWIMLSDETEDGENLVINKWCDAETPFFEFQAEKGDEYKIMLAYGQDGEICDVLFFEAYEEEQELMKVISGEMRFRGEFDDFDRVVDFVWNTETMVAHFEGVGMQSPWFVAEKDMNNFDVIEEDCEGYWE